MRRFYQEDDLITADDLNIINEQIEQLQDIIENFRPVINKFYNCQCNFYYSNTDFNQEIKNELINNDDNEMD